ncbi:ubiquinol oxidase subunit II, partial [uncultured Methylobacterium sp.]|uniref:ubiquinol oxidase subunit II n=1 Tax=uncultured Methylobacterium sp. TaxID=157278 RepID=UPI0035CAA2D1
MFPRLPRSLVLGPLALLLGGLLSGCNVVLMKPSGDVAMQQRDLILASTGLMLLIIVPVIALTALFAWRYRASNEQATYDPDWHHSTQLEVVIWAAPLAIVIALGALTWISTHILDPYRPIGRIADGRPIPAGTKTLTVEVVALDWKWLFFYPEQGIATVNELAAPVDVPIAFKITSASVMNSFFIPALAGQIYAMPGMETKLHAVINKAGAYDGFSANYSGSGFSRMNFKFHGLSQDGFDQWVAKVKGEGKPLNREDYMALEKPSEAEPVRYYSAVGDGLYKAVLNMCAFPDKMCMHEMMHIDAMGGGGKDSGANRARLEYDNRHAQQGDEAPGATFPAAGRESHGDEKPQGVTSGGSRSESGEGGPHQGHKPGATQGGHDHGGHDHGS